MSEKSRAKPWKMRVSFDLDEVLFVSPDDHKTEPALAFPWNKIYKERLREGTVELIRQLRREGFEVWVYTSSFRSESYIRGLFKRYHVTFDGIINGQRHLKEVQRDRRETLPQKVPPHYGISLHVDDEQVVVTYGKLYGFHVYQLDQQNDQWKDEVLEAARAIRERELLVRQGRSD